SPRELLARIKALLRRTAPLTADEPLAVGTLVLDPAAHRVTGRGVPISLGPTEFRLLRFLMSHPNRVQSRARVLDQVWGPNVYVDERTVDVHIRRLRKALSASGHDRLIQTVRGAGYRLTPDAA
ncbi:MAG: winged helix-turn-helix domain-containing protein, partial [Acidiferrobacteraceae bacterium]